MAAWPRAKGPTPARKEALSPRGGGGGFLASGVFRHRCLSIYFFAEDYYWVPIARGGRGGGRAAKQTETPEGQGSHRSRHKGPSVKGTWFSKLRHPRVWARNRRGGKEAANPASAERHVRRGPCRTPGPGTCPPRARLLPPPRDHRCSGPEVTCTPSGAAGWGAGGVSSPLRGICRFGAGEKVF